MSSPEIEKMRGRMREDAVYSAKDIEAICRLEAAYLEECAHSEGGFEEISSHYQEEIATITSRYMAVGAGRVELRENELDR